MENHLDTPQGMDGLHTLAYRKSAQTNLAVCGIMGQLWEYEGMYSDPTDNQFVNDPTPNTITCMANGAEMLRVTPDGFWVRGVRVEQGDKEAEAVYNAFKAWMSWAQLNRDYK
jgi:hypothetical protein